MTELVHLFIYLKVILKLLFVNRLFVTFTYFSTGVFIFPLSILEFFIHLGWIAAPFIFDAC